MYRSLWPTCETTDRKLKEKAADKKETRADHVHTTIEKVLVKYSYKGMSGAHKKAQALKQTPPVQTQQFQSGVPCEAFLEQRRSEAAHKFKHTPKNLGEVMDLRALPWPRQSKCDVTQQPVRKKFLTLQPPTPLFVHTSTLVKFSADPCANMLRKRVVENTASPIFCSQLFTVRPPGAL